MTVLSYPTALQAASIGFAPRGRYAKLKLVFLFALDWYVDLPWVQSRIAKVADGIAFAELFRDIITADNRASVWVKHPEAREHVWKAYEDCERAWTHVLASSPDRNQLALEYLADALCQFKRATTCP